EDLLAARVDALRAAPEDGDRAVRLRAGEVAHHDVAHAVEHEEGARALLEILPVADRHAAAKRELADAARAGLDHPSLVVDDDRVGVHAEAHAAVHALAARVHALRAALRGPEVVEDHQLREVLA